MSAAIVRECAVAEIEQSDNFGSLAREYADECAIHGLPAPVEKLASYQALEGLDVFQGYGAFVNGDLIGFMALITPVIPHYGVGITVAESLFVAKAFRKRGAGLKLIRTAEAHARARKSPGLFISAPLGGALADVLPRLGYRETNRVFLKEIRSA